MDLKRTLYTLNEQLKAERQRADAAEAKTREVLTLFKNANEAKNIAEQEAARANEGLRLYKLQYENAREEIRRAQELINALEDQRVDAEEVAAQARSTARRLKEEKIVMRAREEGRRQGLEEGMAQGRFMGYEEGRAAGYEHGRVAAERELTSAPVTEMDYETPRAQDYQPPRVSRPFTSEDSDQNGTPDYTQPIEDTEPIPPPTRTPVRTPTPAEAIAVQQPVPEQGPLHPIPIHTPMLSPSHAPVDVPPDGWIPSMDGDNRIRLPPPHEMAPPPPTTPSPTLSAVLNNVKNIEEPPAIMIPPPANPSGESSNSRIKHRRRRSTDSHSTTMSQFEILGPPSTATAPSTLRSNVRERPNVLSAIAEERERTSSASSPVYAMPNLSTQSFGMPVPSPGMPVPSLQPPTSQANSAVPPQNPTYPDTTPRYVRSAENLARSGDDYYNRANTPRYGSEASYRSGGQNTRSQEALRDREREHLERERERERLEREHLERDRERERIEREREKERDRMERERLAREREALERERERERIERERLQQEWERLERERERLRAGRSTGGGRYGDNPARRQPSTQNIYAPPHSPHSSPETPTSRTPAIIVPAPSLRQPASTLASENRGSMSSNEIVITVLPPSRPESNVSVAQTEGVFLSADDADRPLPPLQETPAETTPAPSNPVIPPVMSNGPWPPPGFVPTGPPSPAGSSAIGPAGVPLPPSSYGGSTVGAAGVPLPSSVYGGTPSVRSEAVIPGGFPGSNEGPPPVIPLQPSSRSSGSAGSTRKAQEPYSRANIKRREDDSDSSVSSGLGSSDSLTTPPVRNRRLSGRSTPSYAAAPIPAGVQYPVVPPTPRSTTSNSQGSYTSRAARVPLPGSVAGSVSGSVIGSMVGGVPPRSGSVISGGRPPSATGADRPRSPRMGGGRNLASPNMQSTSLPYDPVIPIPIPEPSPITMPVQMPASPRRPTTPLADIDPPRVIPQFTRAPSPIASAVSAATTNATNTTKGKKGKKKR
ncbi:hypothetical protein BD309DRAFT_864571 [Dichomitus squalens]|uniref:Uncharacterized protein n=1 Tax=Dichomitus squalens TaxID=114155 RepID=A0A4Q9MQL0_9APHY|nr:hypothetical protein BD311DRAFT_662790 [Dichomitus squalens]TBU43304.1 hypothetical protein BD309DRAFT_864571 [Dichomitus squalens]TBU63342.1 hypothetical protein BD310DRAFT_809203 [Dichomitus squalens]